MSETSLRARVLEAVHGLAAYGLGPNIGGHVSVRVPGKRHFHINAFDRSFEEMREQDIARFEWRTEVYEFVSDRLAIDLLMGGTHARTVLEAGGDYRDACSDFAQAERVFARRALPHLIYPRARGVFAGLDAGLADRGTP